MKNLPELMGGKAHLPVTATPPMRLLPRRRRRSPSPRRSAFAVGDPPGPSGARPPKPEIYGGIKVVSQTEEDPKAKKKDGMKIYLPPSFMEATLLSGMYAPANEGGKGQPFPASYGSRTWRSFRTP